MAVEITSREELEAWLEDKPRDWAQVVAHRSALRALVLSFFPDAKNDQIVDPRLQLMVLRANAIMWGTRKLLLTDDRSLANAADAASNAAEGASRRSIAAEVAFVAATSGTAFAYTTVGSIAPAMFASAAAKAATVWEVVQGDCRALDDGVTPEKLFQLHLWHDTPDWWGEIWDNARRWLSRPADGFDIWREWYYGRVEGLAHAFGDFNEKADEAFYRWLIQQEDDWWERKPAEVNADIKAKVDSLRLPKKRADFFVSSADGDKALLTQVLSVLDDLGKTYIVPERDGSQGQSNKAIEQAERFIALYSERYVQSEECKAEWIRAYYLDAATAEDRMIAFRFDQADLQPLMYGLSYCDFARLLPAQRKPAIAKWIEWKPRPLSRENVDETLTVYLDPGVVATEDGKLDTKPDAQVNEPELPADLSNAMDVLRMMIDLARQNERNLSSIMQSALKLYDDHFTERGRDSSWGGLDRYMTVLAEGTADLSEDTMREEKSALEQLVAAHGGCIDALGSADEHIRERANIPLRNADPAAIDRLIDRLKAVQEWADDQDVSTQHYDQEARNLVGQGRDFAFEAAAPGAERKPDTARESRFLRYVGGFGIKTLAVLGSIASVRQTPELKKLIEAAEELVDEFYKMIGL